MKSNLLCFALGLVAFPALAQQTSSRALIDMLNQIDQLKSEIQKIRGESDEMRHELDRLGKRQQSLYLDLDQRLLKLEGGGNSGVPGETDESSQNQSMEPTLELSNQPAPSEPPKPEANPTDTQNQERVYEEAFVYLNNGRYDDAIADFKRLIEEYPDGEYADNSVYWLGETYYVKRDFESARAHFNQVIEQFPDSNKIPDAMLKLGYIEYEMAEWKKAREMLKSVIEKFPASNAAKLAQERLDQMRKERH